MDIDPARYIGKLDDIDVVRGVIPSRCYCWRLDQPGETFTVAIDRIINEVPDRILRAGVGISSIDILLLLQGVSEERWEERRKSSQT